MSVVADPSLSSAPAKPALQYVVLTGNPNCGKTTLFNALTGLRARVGNYAGVTVERKEGRLIGAGQGSPVTLLDLPGTYSLSPQSLDEQIARDVLFNRVPEVPSPALVVVVVDASNLERNLYYATQVIELGYPTLIALNMVDVAEENGRRIDADLLAEELGVPVVPLVASKGTGLPQLRQRIFDSLQGPPPAEPKRFFELPPHFSQESRKLAEVLLRTFNESPGKAQAEALLLLSDEKMLARGSHYTEEIRQTIAASRQRLENMEVDWRSVLIEARYARIAAIQAAAMVDESVMTETFTDKLDRIVTHRFWGMLVFVGIMGVMFYTIFAFAQVPMEFLQETVARFGGLVGGMIPPGDLQSLLVKGVIQGVGAVVVFVPQICLLFLFIGLLEDTGYMARAAFLMDRLMSKVGLHGKSFIPLLSSFACAIPGIMATRTIETPKDRLVTILVAPLMSCSARLPVYLLLIAAVFPDRKLLAALTMLSMYLLGIVAALLMALLFKKTLLRGPAPLLIMELPPYKQPLMRIVLRHMWERSKLFLKRAGTVILAINILLWFLASYPKSGAIEQEFAAKKQEAALVAFPEAASAEEAEELRADQLAALETAEAGEKVRNSFAGRMGRAIEPAIKPLGFDWQIGIGIIASFAAREVFVSTMSIVYNVAEADDEETHTRTLAQTMKQQTRPDGSPVYTPLTSITLMVFFVLAMQCVSTVAIVRRETNTWKWPLFQWLYMGVLAWSVSFITYHGGKLLGFE
jgi:ferrous iron transport protein B